MRPISAIDCETDPFKVGRFPKPFVWGNFDERGYKYFRRFKPLLNWLEKPDDKRLVYAHNAGKFDFLFKELIKEIPDFTMMKIIHGRLAQFKIRKLEFRDSYSAVPVALKEYKKDDIKYWKLEKKHRKKYWKEIIKYLKTDVVALHELMSARNEQYGPTLTLAGASLKAACKIHDIESPKSTYAYFKRLKPYYYGGRTQCHVRGIKKGPIFSVDINSAYPYAMGYDHPWGARFFKQKSKFPKNIPDRSFIEIDVECRGALPEGTLKFGTKFPDDGKRRILRISGWEYNTARKLKMLGKKPKIKTLYTFFEKQNFKKYIKHFYNIRKSAAKGSPEKIFGKLFMNSLYGRMGLAGNEYKQYMIAPFRARKKMFKEGWHQGEETVDERVIYFRDEPRERWRFHDVAVAASVTGFVRAMLVQAMALLRKKGFLIYYCDTDGIHCFHPKLKPKAAEKLLKRTLKFDDELGNWKLDAVFTRMSYGGKKLYAGNLRRDFWEKKDGKLVKAKKAHKGAILTREQIEKIARGGTVIYERESPSMGILTGSRFIRRKIKATV